jgi:hypothetical protein
MEFPEEWDARISYVEGTPGPVVEAATIPLPEPGPDALYHATSSMRPDDVIFGLHDQTGACPCAGFQGIATPISIRPEDFTKWDGLDETHSLAVRSVLVNGRSIVLWATFGTDPAPQVRLGEVNQILASMTLADSAGDPSDPSPDTWRPPTFEPGAGWNVVSTGPVHIGPEAFTETWAANVPFAEEDLRFNALAGQLSAWPDATMKRLPADGVVMATWIDAPGEARASPNRGFPARDLPLQLAEAEVQSEWEGQVAPNVPFHWIRSTGSAPP